MTTPDGWDELGAAFREAAAGERDAFVDVDAAAVRARASALARTVRSRNLRETLAAAVVVAAGIRLAWIGKSTLVQVGGVAMALGALVVAFVIARRGGSGPAPPPTAPTSEVVEHERAELERQAELLQRVWLWYVAPLLPAIVAIYVDAFRRAPDGRGTVVALAAGTVAFLAGVVVFNRRAARALRQRTDAVLPRAPRPG